MGGPRTGLGVRDIVGVGIDLASSIEARLGCKRWPCGNLSYKQTNKRGSFSIKKIKYVFFEDNVMMTRITKGKIQT